MTIFDRRTARKVIAAHYGEEFAASVRFLSRSAQIGNRPIVDSAAGKLTLAWQSLAPGSDSAVKVGILHDPSVLEVNWDAPLEMLLRPPGAAQEHVQDEPEASRGVVR
jgi:hypothetical protein